MAEFSFPGITISERNGLTIDLSMLGGGINVANANNRNHTIPTNMLKNCTFGPGETIDFNHSIITNADISPLSNTLNIPKVFNEAGEEYIKIKKVIYDRVSDSSGNWTVDCSAAKFTNIVDVRAFAWKSSDVAVEQVNVTLKSFTNALVSGSVITGKKITKLVGLLGEDTIIKSAPNIPVRIIIEGTY
jgi:hypothetical protein